MKETSCNVIRDLLALYEDEAVSEETAELVRKHLAGCAGCREELRKMRTPISVPPEEDKELLERFEARRAKQRRNKRIAITSAVTAVVAIILFCVWYIRPRSWESLVGTDEVSAVYGNQTEYNFHVPESWGTDSTWNYWRLEEPSGDSEAARLIINALRKSSYRADLGNLRNYTPFPREVLYGKGVDTVNLTLLYTQEGREYITIAVDGGGQASIYTSWEHRKGIFAYQADEDLHQALVTIMHEYGVLEED